MAKSLLVCFLLMSAVVVSCHADSLRAAAPRAFLSTVWDFVFGTPTAPPEWPLPPDSSFMMVASSVRHEPGSFRVGSPDVTISSKKFGTFVFQVGTETAFGASGDYFKVGERESYSFNSEAGICTPTFYPDNALKNMGMSAENFDPCPEQPEGYDAFQFNKNLSEDPLRSYKIFFRKGTADLDHTLSTYSFAGRKHTSRSNVIYFSTEVPELPRGLADAIKPCQPYQRSDAGVQGPWQATLKSEKSGSIVTVDSAVIDGKRNIRYDVKKSDGSTLEAAIFVYDKLSEDVSYVESYSYDSVFGPGCHHSFNDEVLTGIDVKFHQHDRLPLMGEHEGKKEYGHEKFVKNLGFSTVKGYGSLWEISNERKLAIAGKSVVYDAETKNPVEFKITCTEGALEHGQQCQEETFTVTKFVREAPDASVFEPSAEWGCNAEGAIPGEGLFPRAQRPGPYNIFV